MGSSGSLQNRLPEPLRVALEQSRDLGFLGAGPLDRHLLHAAGFAEAVETLGFKVDGESQSVLDLGSGGGIPGLLLASLWPQRPMVLLEAQQRRVDFLNRAIDACGWRGRVTVLHGRAELLARRGQLRHQHPVVVARSFGLPAVVAECASPFLTPSGVLVVSEPPPRYHDDTRRSALQAVDRWPSIGLAVLGLDSGTPFTSAGGFSYRVLRQVDACPDTYPRRVGVPAKKPLF
jgi:16S rRNA (guanine527-N7)-methyltransferase